MGTAPEAQRGSSTRHQQTELDNSMHTRPANLISTSDTVIRENEGGEGTQGEGQGPTYSLSDHRIARRILACYRSQGSPRSQTST